MATTFQKALAKFKVSRMRNQRQERKILAKASKMYVEQMFPYLNSTLCLWESLLGIAANANSIMLNERTRAEVKAWLAEPIDTIDETIRFLREHVGKGNVIANSIFNSATKARAAAEVMLSVCDTGNMQRAGWETPLKMFKSIERGARTGIKSIEVAFANSTIHSVKTEVMNDLRRIYLNDIEDHMATMEHSIH